MLFGRGKLEGKREGGIMQTRMKYHLGQLPKREQVLTGAADSAIVLMGLTDGGSAPPMPMGMRTQLEAAPHHGKLFSVNRGCLSSI